MCAHYNTDTRFEIIAGDGDKIIVLDVDGGALVTVAAVTAKGRQSM